MTPNYFSPNVSSRFHEQSRTSSEKVKQICHEDSTLWNLSSVELRNNVRYQSYNEVKFLYKFPRFCHWTLKKIYHHGHTNLQAITSIKWNCSISAKFPLYLYITIALYPKKQPTHDSWNGKAIDVKLFSKSKY